MSTRSFIAKQIGEDLYRTIYCHSDGYLTYNGAMLLDHYNTPEQVDALLALGDISSLGEDLEPDPSRLHSFDYDERQAGVTVAYARDRGDRNVAAREMSLKELDDPSNWTAYVYVYTMENKWEYFEARHSSQGFRDVEEDLNREYAAYGLARPEGYYGFLTHDIAEEIRLQENEHGQVPSEDTPVLEQ